MKAEEKKELEQNSLAAGAATLVEKAKAGELLSARAYRWIFLALGVVLLGGLWFYLSNENKKANSKMWAEIANPTMTDLEATATAYKDTATGRIARLELARIQLGAGGIGRLNIPDREAQNKAIANIETAREEFTKLGAEFKGDKSLQAASFVNAAEAELALVGVPKDAVSQEHRGKVKTAAEFYKKAATAIGEKTPAGEQFTKKAEELTNRDAELTKIGLDLYNRVAPMPAFDATRPGVGIQPPVNLDPRLGNPVPSGINPPVNPIIPTTPTTAPNRPITPTTAK
jgi:hypothetical protein